MAICPRCRETMGLKDVRCPRCGYDFPDAGDDPPESPTVVGTLLRWALAFAIFAVAWYPLSFTMIRFGEPVTAFWFVFHCLQIAALAIVSFWLARRVTEWAARRRAGRPPAP
jgi:hypothetical protein